MKFDHLVDVSFHNFVFNGKFDFVELGQTMAWLDKTLLSRTLKMIWEMVFISGYLVMLSFISKTTSYI